MHHTKHSVVRMNQRGITHAMAELVFTYGVPVGDKIILNQKAALARLTEARAELAALERNFNIRGTDLFAVMLQVPVLEEEIRNLLKLTDKHGLVIVIVGDDLLTAYGLH